MLHASKGLHLLPEVVRIGSLPERGIEDIMGMWPKVDVDLLGDLEIRPYRRTTPTPGRVTTPVTQQGRDPLLAYREHRGRFGMTVTPPDAVHAQGEELASRPHPDPARPPSSWTTA